MMNISPRQYNITEFYTDVQISNSAYLPVVKFRQVLAFLLLLTGLNSKTI